MSDALFTMDGIFKFCQKIIRYFWLLNGQKSDSNEYFFSPKYYFLYFTSTVKLEFKEWLNKEQLSNSEPFLVTNMPVYLINSEQIGFSEQLCSDQKVP